MIAGGTRWIVYPSRSDVFSLWYVADLHLMNSACSEEHIKSDIKKISEDPYSFMIGGGDYGDFIGYADTRFDPDAVAPWVSVKDLGNLGQIGMVRCRDFFLPAKDKILGLLIGNHEKKYELRTEHEGLHGWLCTELGVPSLEYCALFDLIFVRYSKAKRVKLYFEAPPEVRQGQSCRFRIFCHHGAGYAQTPGGK